MEESPQSKNLNDSKVINDEIDSLISSDTPQFPKHIYKLLPKFLRETTAFFDEGRERDIFFASCLAVLSGCLPGVQFQHDRKTYKTNLFLFIIGPPASGKGIMNYAKYLAQPIQREFLNENKRKKEDYNSDLTRFRSLPSKDKICTDEPLEPDYQYLFIPANSSSASFVETMASTPSSIMFESEADTLGNTLKQDWSGYSDVLRKAFEHETHSQNRKGSGNYLEIEDLCLSVALSGTPCQLKGIIPNTEDGLFSRFMFYSFKGDPKFRNVFESKSEKVSYKELLDPYANELRGLYEKCQQWKEVQFSWRPEQADQLQKIFEKWTSYYVKTYGVEVKSIVFRFPVILTRIAAILTVLRNWEYHKYSNKDQVCSGKDFDVALAIAKTFIEHSMHIYSQLLRKDHTQYFSQNKKEFYQSLPEKFETKDAESIGLDLDIAARTVRKYLHEWVVNGLVVKLDQGKYEKTK